MKKKVIWVPNPGSQVMYLESWAREVLIGGAVGGGKTDVEAMGALRWVDRPEYSAILFRRERDDLQEVIDRTREIYPQICRPVPPRWVETRNRWEFPSGATIQMGYAQHELDIQAFKTFQFQHIAFDELTTFTQYQYTYMLSRNRGKLGAGIPFFMRGGTNPDGIGHAWVYKRFVENRDPYVVYRYPSDLKLPSGEIQRIYSTRQFIPSTVFDNPMLDHRDEYIAGLQAMGKDLAEALLYGRWDYFRGQMFPYAIPEVDVGVKESPYYVIRALDHGWTDPTVVYWLVVYPQAKPRPVVEVAHELVVAETNIDEIARLIRLAEDELAFDTPTFSVIDPSTVRAEATSGGQNIKSMYEAQGVWFEKANNDRQAGWAQIRRLLESGRLRAWEGKCPMLLQTLPKLIRDPNKADDIKPKQNDHPADTLRYGTMAFFDAGLEGMPVPEPTDPTFAGHSHQDDVYPRLIKQLQEGQGSGTFSGEFGPGF